MTRFRAVLFDVFGTLVPCYPLGRLHEVIALMALELGVEPDAFAERWHATFNRRRRGVYTSVRENVQEIAHELAARRDHAGIDSAAERRLTFERSTLVPRSSTLATLLHLKQLGLQTGIITNCSLETAEIWPDSQLCSATDHSTLSCRIGSEKPEPAVYLEACAALGVEPRDCLFVGDGSNDELDGARKLGMTAVLIRAEDDDGSFPGRITPDAWPGLQIADLGAVVHLVNDQEW